MSTTLRHTGLVVVDLDRAIEFWCDTLGLKVLRRMEESGRDLASVMGLEDVTVTTVKLIDPNGGILELLRFHSHTDVPEWVGRIYSTGLSHVALTVDDVDAICQKVAELGGSHNPVRLSSDGGAKMTFCRGPEGVLVELVELVKVVGP